MPCSSEITSQNLAPIWSERQRRRRVNGQFLMGNQLHSKTGHSSGLKSSLVNPSKWFRSPNWSSFLPSQKIQNYNEPHDWLQVNPALNRIAGNEIPPTTNQLVNKSLVPWNPLEQDFTVFLTWLPHCPAWRWTISRILIDYRVLMTRIDLCSKISYTRSSHSAIFGTGKKLYSVNFALSEYWPNVIYSTSAT